MSRDGTTVRFSYDRAGQELARFDLMQGLLRGGNSAGDLAPARTQAPGLNLAGWQNTPEPTLNGRPLRLYANENALAVAISPDGASFALGSAGRVRLYDRNGTVRWQVAGQGAAWAVNITGNGRTVVAGFADGTIHWYDIQNGREELAFFPFGDRKRWIAWTPSGYYQASVGGEDLIGWQLNRGGDAAADFFPASLFRSRFNRPDLIVHALSAPSEADALRMADAYSGRKSDAHPVSVQTVLPPVVEIVAPADETAVTSPSVTLHYAARSPSDAPVTALRVRVNGQAVALQARGLSVEAKGNERELTVPIGEEDSQIELFAENKNGVSTPATVHLTWGGKKSATAWDAASKPKLYVLAVGVSKYQNVNFNLGLPAKDAHDFADVLRKQKGKLYAEVQVRLLTDADATCDNVVSGLEWLANQVRQNNVGIMFLAGHGVNDNYGKYFFIPYNGDPSKLLLTGVAQNDIRDTLSKLVGKAVFFVDTCHAGNALGTAKGSGSETSVDAFVNDLSADENGVVVFAAATSRQFSLEDAAWGNGAFTKAVVEGLNGKADLQKQGKVSVKGLDYYVDGRVKELTSGKQSPTAISPSGYTDFTIATLN